MNNMPGHQRNASQGQHLIVDRHESGDEEDLEKGSPISRAPPDVSTGGVFPTSQPDHPVCRPHDNQIKGGCRDPRLKKNIKLVLGSILLTVIGAVLLVYGVLVFFKIAEDRAGVQVFAFFFAGLLCFIPGFYHVFYIICTLCGCEVYSLDKLPTFRQ